MFSTAHTVLVLDCECVCVNVMEPAANNKNTFIKDVLDVCEVGNIC